MRKENASSDVIRVAIIYGSIREGRFCDKVASWAIREIAQREGFFVQVIDPVKQAANEIRQHVRDAEAFLVVTPEYNHSYPAALKVLIDSIHEEWHAKPVAFISYGGISGGIRAVEHLRQVFAELHAVTMRDTVTFANAWTQFDDAGTLRQPEAARKSLSVLLKRLAWWGQVLREAREANPYSLAGKG